MIPILIDGPAVEPVTLAEMKAYLRVDDDDGTQDDLIAGPRQGRPPHGRGRLPPHPVEQRWRVVLDRWPRAGGAAAALAADRGRAHQGVRRRRHGVGSRRQTPSRPTVMSDPPRIVVLDRRRAGPPAQRHRHRAARRIRRAAEEVPATLRLAVKILVARWFENRGDVAGEQILPPEALALVAPFRRARLVKCSPLSFPRGQRARIHKP